MDAVIVASAQGLYRLDSSGRQLRQISNEAADQPRWSADGLWVAYLTQSIDSAKQEQFLWLMHPDGSAVQQLATSTIWHEWSPTGHTLGYLTGNTPSLANESATVSLANQLYYLWITMPDRVPRLIAEVNEPIFAWGH
ncbi:MAG: hypothetical protein R2867_45130 [Caldilineaceae bacterium]